MRGRRRAGARGAARRGGAGDAGPARRVAERRGAPRRLGAGADGLRLSGLGARGGTRGRRGVSAGGWVGDAGGRRPFVSGGAVPVGRDDGAGDRLLRSRAHGLPASGAPRPARRRSARGRSERGRGVASGRLDHLRRAGRPHRVLGRRGANPALDRPGKRARRDRGGGAGVPARAPPQARASVITWATSDGREDGGDRVVPAASTIKIFVASAFWRSGLDPAERVAVVPHAAWSVADRLTGPLTLADCALLMLAFSDNAATNVLLQRLGF